MVASVEPDTGSPPTQAEPMLPRPWPINSRVLWCRVPVFRSATTEVSKVSMEASTLSVKAGTRSPASSSGPTSGASATMPKAMASGRAITEVVTPPIRSPRSSAESFKPAFPRRPRTTRPLTRARRYLMIPGLPATLPAPECPTVGRCIRSS